jgi:hypothetical protein
VSGDYPVVEILGPVKFLRHAIDVDRLHFCLLNFDITRGDLQYRTSLTQLALQPTPESERREDFSFWRSMGRIASRAVPKLDGYEAAPRIRQLLFAVFEICRDEIHD